MSTVSAFCPAPPIPPTAAYVSKLHRRPQALFKIRRDLHLQVEVEVESEFEIEVEIKLEV
jgi:hypothetical protein